MVKTIGNVQKDAQVRAVASGALSNGDTIIVNSDGTVSAVEETSISQGIGSEVVIDTGANQTYKAAVFDSANNKVVILYRDEDNQSYGTAVVGTISGTSISFGSPVVFRTGTTLYISAAFDSANGKVVVAYRDNSNNEYGTAVVGTVSGTSISFGSKVVFESAGVAWTSTSYDSANGKVVISYTDIGNSLFGTAIVGTVSGTSISFGSPELFEADYSLYNFSVYDSNSGKTVICYADTANSFYGTAIVGTVSGTSISFGSPVVFKGNQVEDVTATFDSLNNKVIVAYRHSGNSSDNGIAQVGTVSGTSISFGSEQIFDSNRMALPYIVFDSNAGKITIPYYSITSTAAKVVSGTVSGTSITFSSATTFNSANTQYITSAFDSDNNKVAIAYTDDGNSGRATSIVFQNASTSTNLTSDNFIGFADGAYADTQSAVINTTCSVDRNQTGLTAGQKYYVQTDGSLGTTAADPSVEAGTAISSTEILVKG